MVHEIVHSSMDFEDQGIAIRVSLISPIHG